MQILKTAPNPPKSLRRAALVMAAAALCLTPQADAAPYATSLTNDAGTVYFRLNESADAVSVIHTNLSGNFVTNNLGALAAGLHSSALSVPGAFSVTATKFAGPGYVGGASLQISDDATNTVKFNSPRGVAVNQNPASPYFGRIYVANSADGTASGRTLTDGIYLMNADFTDAVGQGDTALTNGLNVAGSGSTPYRLEIGQDDNLYIASWATGNGGIFVADPNMTSAQDVIGSLNSIGSSIVAEGSLGGGNLKIYAMDSDSTNGVNGIKLWDIGAGPLPTTFVPTNVANDTVLAISSVIVDMAKGPDGKFYTAQRRALIPNEGGIFVVDPTVDGGVFNPGADGLWDKVYDSRAESIGLYGEPYDILYETGGVAISPDGKWMAVMRYSGSDTWIIPLVNGIPDLSGRKLIETGSVTAGRDIGFDAAGNFYMVSSGNAILRVFSPGYTSVATTGSDGTFSVTNVAPETVVSLTGTITNAMEGGSDGQFAFSRSGGDLSQPLTVTYTISGTATRGQDYNTNSISATNIATVTFPAFSTYEVVNIPVINDTQGEPTETVIFTLLGGTNYTIQNNVPITVFIDDDGDKPTLSLSVTGLGISELLPGRPAKLRLNIATPDQNDVTGQIQVSGATSGVDFVEAANFNVTVLAGSNNVNFAITPINNSIVSSNKIITVSLLTNANYGIGTTSVTFVLRDDDTPPVPILFADNFDTNSSSLWTVNANNGDSESIFAYDYSVMGIPPAPKTTNGTTLGLRFRSNLSLGAAAGISASPIGLSAPANYRLRFDVWMNFNGPLPVNGTGSTEYFTAGIGVSGSRTNTTASTSLPGPSVIVGATGEGGSSGDYNVYLNGITQTAASIYGAGSRDNAATYYAELGELPCPAIQIANYPATQTTGVTLAGTTAFAWHDVVLTKIGTNYTWTIDGLTIASFGYATTPIGNNVSIGYQDVFASLSANQDVSFAVFDNVVVESLTVAVPVITSITLINSGADVQVDFTAGASDLVSAFTLQSTGDITTPFGDVASTITSLGGGNFRAVRAAAGTAQYYRIKR